MTQGINLKHLDVRRDKLLYRRRIPKDLISVCGKTTWYRQLQCKVDASDSEIVEAWNEAHKSFEAMVKLTRSNFSKEISEERQTRDALRYLDFFKLKSGELSQAHQTYGLDPWELEPKAFRPLEERFALRQKYDYENQESPFDDFDVVHPPTPVQQTAQKAWELAIAKSAKVKPKCLISECWDIYNGSRDQGSYDIDSREGRRVYASWERFITFLGRDCLLEDTDSIHEAIDKMVEARLTQVSPASVQRDWNVISAVLNSAVKRDRLNIRFQKPPIKKVEKTDRPVFSQTDQREIIGDVVAGKYSTENGVLMLLALQAGMINSELQRLKSENVRLGDEVPHILVTGEVKTKDRLRTVPITVGVRWLRKAFKELEVGSGWAMRRSFHSASDSTISKRVVVALDSYRQRDNRLYSAYSFRHAFKANAIAHNAGDRYLYIAGWKNKETAISDTYARDAMTQVEVLGGLREVSETINRHLLDIDYLTLVASN